MKTRQQLVDDFEQSCQDVQEFVNNASYSGGMHMEARIKLLENRVEDLYWFVRQLIHHVPEQIPEEKNET